MSVGGVGAVGAVGAGAAAGAAGGGAAVGSAAGSSGAGDVGSVATGDSNVSSDKTGNTDAAEKFAPGSNNTNVNINVMSTQDQLQLHNSVNSVNKSSECGEMDLQKLIEMMIAIKLLKEMSNQEGGFSTTA